MTRGSLSMKLSSWVPTQLGRARNLARVLTGYSPVGPSVERVDRRVARRNAVLVLLYALQRQIGRPVRISELYLYTREVLVRRAVTDDLARELRDADPSVLFLLLEELRADGLAEAVRNEYTVTAEGAQVVNDFEHAHALHEGALDDAAAAVA